MEENLKKYSDYPQYAVCMKYSKEDLFALLVETHVFARLPGGQLEKKLEDLHAWRCYEETVEEIGRLTDAMREKAGTPEWFLLNRRFEAALAKEEKYRGRV
jgi:hypothetical protein